MATRGPHYDEWKKKADESGYYFSDADLAHAAYDPEFADLAFDIKDRYAKAETGAERSALHDEMEAARKQYNYSGGTRGNEYNPLGKPSYDYTGGITAGLEAARAALSGYGDYADPYAGQIRDLTGQIMNRKPFSYDPASDPLYQQYAQQYERNGRRAMDDTLAQISARTGGLASSYAAAAGNQAYGRYMDALGDRIPELYKLAYDMYSDEGNNLRANLAMLQGLSDTGYNRWGDGFNRLLSGFDVENSLYGVNAAERAYADEKARPELSLAETMSLIESGNRTPNVLAAWEYYMGEPYAEAVEAGSGSRGGGDDGDNGDDGEDYPVDMASVLALGKGPISAEEAAKLVEDGDATVELIDGQWVFKKKGQARYTQPMFTPGGSRFA